MREIKHYDNGALLRVTLGVYEWAQPARNSMRFTAWNDEEACRVADLLSQDAELSALGDDLEEVYTWADSNLYHAIGDIYVWSGDPGKEAKRITAETIDIAKEQCAILAREAQQ
jgi:hypothetical protein